jgi:type IV secretion system protein VirB1
MPLAVHSADNIGYRIALRSMPMEAVVTAPKPGLTPATHADIDGDPAPATEAAAPMADFSSISANATVQPRRGDAPSPPSTAPVRRSAAPELASATADGVFEPQVRGPGDPAVASAATDAGPSTPRHDNADLRMEHRDAAFVF